MDNAHGDAGLEMMAYARRQASKVDIEEVLYRFSRHLAHPKYSFNEIVDGWFNENEYFRSEIKTYLSERVVPHFCEVEGEVFSRWTQSLFAGEEGLGAILNSAFPHSCDPGDLCFVVWVNMLEELLMQGIEEWMNNKKK